MRNEKENSGDNGFDLTPEQQLLIYCARLELDEASAEGINSIVANDPDWRIILRLSEKHGIQSLLNKHLHDKKTSQTIPSRVLEELSKDVFRQSLRAFLLNNELDRFFAVAIKAQLPVIPLKGSFLAENVYKDISLRPMGDIDILSKKRDIPKFHDLLTNLGYYQVTSTKNRTHEEIASHIDPYYHPKGFCIEVHTHLFKVFGHSEVQIESIWEHASVCNKYGAPVRRLSYATLLLFLIIHLVKHLKGDRHVALYWICDIHEVVQQYGDKIEWNSFVEQSEILGVKQAVGTVFGMIRLALGTKIPESVLLEFQNPYENISIERIFSEKINARQYYLNRVKCLWELKSFQDKMQYCFGTFFPSSAYLRTVYELGADSSVWPYYIRHPIDVALRAFKRLALHKIDL